MERDNMGEKNNKTLQFLLVHLAFPIASGVVVNNFRLTQLLGIPSYVYLGVLIILFFWTLYGLFSILRNWIIRSRDAKQYNPTSFGMHSHNAGNTKIDYEYGGFNWLIYIDLGSRKHILKSQESDPIFSIDFVLGPLCPQENCFTDLNTNKTYFGKYKFYCPSCSFKRKSNRSASTLERDVVKALKGEVRRQGFKHFKVRE